MATNTRTGPGARSHEHSTATAEARARINSVAETVVALLPALVLLGAVLVGFSNPAAALVLFGLPAAAVLGLALIFGVARAGAAISSRV